MAGIKFYLCQTEDGPQLVHLQSDAKKTDPDYETIEIDTSKQPLMERLNELMRRAHAAESAEQEGPAFVSRPVPPPSPVHKDERIQRTYDQVGFEEFIWDIPPEEVFRLATFEEIIRERRDEIENPGRREPAPQPSLPPRKQWGQK